MPEAPDKSPQTTTFSQADFISAMAEETGLSPGQLTRRADPEANPETDPLTIIAQARAAERQVDPSAQADELMEQLGLYEQIYDQRNMLQRHNIIIELPSHQFGIVGIDGQEYPMPTVEQIEASLTAEQIEVLGNKVNQGFNKLLLVPFGLPLRELVTRTDHALMELRDAGTLPTTDSNGTSMIYDFTEGEFKDENMLYYPTSFEADNIGGKTKHELLAESSQTPGWQIILVEDLPELPREGEGETTEERAQIEAGLSSEQYLEITTSSQAAPEYAHEVGMTPEAYLMAQLTAAGNGEPLDKVTYTRLIGAYFVAGARAGQVPNAYWDPDGGQLRLSAAAPGDADPVGGVRSTVRVT